MESFSLKYFLIYGGGGTLLGGFLIEGSFLGVCGGFCKRDVVYHSVEFPADGNLDILTLSKII